MLNQTYCRRSVESNNIENQEGQYESRPQFIQALMMLLKVTRCFTKFIALFASWNVPA